jgi:hypothetical protein
MDRQALCWLCLIVGLGACASSKPTMYDEPAIQSVKTWTVGYAYESGSGEEPSLTEAGAEALVMTDLRRARDWKLRDDIAISLRDHNNIDASQAPRQGAGQILLQTTSGILGFASVDVEIILPSGKTAGRIHVENGDREATFRNDHDFAEYAANAIAVAMRGER